MSTKAKKFLPDNVIELLFGLGASIVIIGALMKITHYNPDIISSNTMLSIGLIAEAIIFAIAGIQGYMAGDSSVEDKGLQTIEAETQSLQKAVDQTVSGLSSLNKNLSAAAAATQLQDLINTTISEGWEFVTITSMSTSVKATGCGKSNAPALKTSIQLLI